MPVLATSPLRRRLLRVLGDGEVHSGQELAQTLGVSRTAIWKHLKLLRELGVPCQTLQGRGYRLGEAIEPLDPEIINTFIEPRIRRKLAGIRCFDRLNSTSTYVLDVLHEVGAPLVCLAESQTAGRGRRGRTWVSPYGRNIYLSLSWRFDSGASAVMGLSVAVGVALAGALRSFGLPGIAVKWPNDLYLGDRKLGGILVDLRGDALGPWWVVVGLGVNVNMLTDPASLIDQPWTSIRQALDRPVDRNQLAAFLTSTLIETLEKAGRGEHRELLRDWPVFDYLADKEVLLAWQTGTLRGRAAGITPQGALLLNVGGDLREILNGEVSVCTKPRTSR